VRTIIITLSIIIVAIGIALFAFFTYERLPDSHVEPAEELKPLTSSIRYEEPIERFSPANHITQDQILVYPEEVNLLVENTTWSKFADTNSMDPVFDIGHNSIQFFPEKEEDIKVGDIVAYNSKFAEGLIIHRVVEIDYDTQGWYAILKGDNNARRDPGRVRFNQTDSVLVTIIY